MNVHDMAQPFLVKTQSPADGKFFLYFADDLKTEIETCNRLFTFFSKGHTLLLLLSVLSIICRINSLKLLHYVSSTRRRTRRSDSGMPWISAVQSVRLYSQWVCERKMLRPSSRIFASLRLYWYENELASRNYKGPFTPSEIGSESEIFLWYLSLFSLIF